ncbi:MAG: PhzF family phenazine biosynthesis protein [Bacillota bacterium]
MIRIKQVDAFTGIPFGGNPAGVVTDARDLTEGQMQRVAAEMNLSETAFVVPSPDQGADFNVRFFTPKNEVDLCGHATIATFFTLAEEGRIRRSPEQASAVVKQRTKAGILAVEVEFANGVPDRVMMTQAEPQFRATTIDREQIAAVLGLRAAQIRTDWPLELAYTGLWHLMVPVVSAQAVDAAQPDLAKLTELNRSEGVHTTHLIAPSGHQGSLVYTRDYAPAVGIPEDPATGTGSGAMGAYLVKNALLRTLDSAELGEHHDGSRHVSRFVSLQGYAINRPSQITIEVTSEGGRPILVKVGGRAVCMLDGSMRVT